VTAKYMQGMSIVFHPILKSNGAAVDSFGHGQDVIVVGILI
jgi:hypothetical protein